MLTVLKLLLIELATLFTSVIVANVIILILGSSAGELDTATKDVISIASQFLFSVGFVVYLVWNKYVSFNRETLRISGFRIFLLSVVGFVALMSGIDVLESRVLHWMPNFLEDMEMNSANVFAMVVYAPLLEEIVFRGAFLKALLEEYKLNKAILISAVIFSIIHINPAQLIPTFLAGLLLGWIYYRTKNLSLCIILHAINNIAYVVLFKMTDGNGFNRESFPIVADIAILLLSVAVIYFSTKLISRLTLKG